MAGKLRRRLAEILSCVRVQNDVHLVDLEILNKVLLVTLVAEKRSRYSRENELQSLPEVSTGLVPS